MRARRIGRAAAALTAIVVSAASVLPGTADPYGAGETLPPSAPVGWIATVEALAPTATSLAFSPGGDALYVSSGGSVARYPIVAGHVGGAPTTFLSGLVQPLGVLATAGGVFVSDQVAGKGIVYRARDTNGNGVSDVRETVVSQLPNGRHNTNGLALGPDGMLYIANGNRTDSGFGSEGGPPEVRPYSGSVLRVSPSATGLLPDPSMVVATGFRNIYDIAFFPGTSIAAVSMNGPDGQRYAGVQRPVGEDTLSIFDTTGAVEHFGFPWCLYDRNNGGLAGFTQSASQGSCTPLPPTASSGLSGIVQAFPSALFGANVSADGLEFDPATGDLYVTEWGNLFGTVPKGHKVVRVRFDGGRNVLAVENFMNGGAPLDLTFAPDGTMWVADYAGAILRLERVV